jgi:hypothetical protein
MWCCARENRYCTSSTIFFDYTKIEAGHLQIEEKTFNFYSLVDSVLDLLGPKGANDGLAIVVTFADAIPENWLGDEIRLR